MFIKISKTIMGSLMLFSLDRLVTKNQILNTKCQAEVFCCCFNLKKKKKRTTLPLKIGLILWHTQLIV